MFIDLRRICLLLISLALFSDLCSAHASTRHEAFLLITNASAGEVSFFNPATPASPHTMTLATSLHERLWRSADQHYAYFSSIDGWVIKLDLHTQQIAQQLRVGQSTSGIALSHDGRFIMVANLSPMTLVALDAADLSILRTIDVKDKAGKASGVVSIHTAATRQSFIAVMGDIPELWELSYDKNAEPVYEGFVHDYKMAEAIALRGPFAPRRTLLEQPLNSFIFDRNFTHAIGSNDAGLLQVINLDIRRKIRDLRFPPKIQADAGATWRSQDRQVLALASEKQLNIIDLHSGDIIQKIVIAGGNIRLHTHDNSAYVWIESGTNEKRKIEILEKQALKLVSTPPAIIARCQVPLGWADNGRLAILADDERKALVLLDTKTLELVQRLDLPTESSPQNSLTKDTE